MLRLILLLFPVFIMSACSGDGDRVAVEGLGYDTGTYSGTTDSRGQYLSAEDDTDVVFSLGGTEIATLPATGTVTVTDLISVDSFPDSLEELLPAYTSNEANELHQAVNTVGLLALFDNNNDLTDGIDLRDWDKRLQPLSLDLNVSAREFFISRLGEVAQLAGFDPLSDIPEPSALLYNLYEITGKELSAELISTSENIDETGKQLSSTKYQYLANGLPEYIENSGWDYSFTYSDDFALAGIKKIREETNVDLLTLELNEQSKSLSVFAGGDQLYYLIDLSWSTRDWVGYSSPHTYFFNIWPSLLDKQNTLSFQFDERGRRIGLTQSFEFTDNPDLTEAQWEQAVERDSLGRVTSSEAHFYIDDSVSYEKSLVKTTNYSDNGLVNQLVSTRRIYADGDLDEEWVVEKEFNDQGRLIRQTSLADRNLDGINEITYESRRRFNEKGQIESVSYGAPDDISTTTYTYDEQDRLILEESATTTTRYAYDDSGFLSEVLTTYADWTEREIYINGEIVSRVTEYETATTTTLYSQSESRGQVVHTTETTRVDTEGEIESRSVRTNVDDSQGRWVLSHYQSDTDGDGILDRETRSEYGYTEAGKLASRNYEETEDGVVVYSRTYSYTYSSFDNVTRVIPMLPVGLSREYPLNHWTDYTSLESVWDVSGLLFAGQCLPGESCIPF